MVTAPGRPDSRRDFPPRMAAVEIHVFHCGQGDTILLHLDDRKWVLVDCHLPGRDAVARFLGLLDGLGVDRLDFVLLSHPDSDHYTGMDEVLAHYARSPDGLGTFCDNGFDVKLLPDKSCKDLKKLYQCIRDLRKAGAVRYQTLAAYLPPSAENATWPVELCVLSPVNSDVQFASISALIGGKRDGANEYSLIIVILSGAPPLHFCGLLPGDAGGVVLSDALARLPESSPARDGFDFVKISHHGSWDSHRDSPVAERVRVQGKSVAVVSSRSSSLKIPRREVLDDYLARGWRVYDTSRRRDDAQPAVGSELIHALAWRDGSGGHHDIHVKWARGKALSVKPVTAQVVRHHLPLYPSRSADAPNGR